MATPDFSSPESAYCTKDNILVPKNDPRTAAAIQTAALAQVQTVNPRDTITATTLPVKEA